MTDEPQTKNQPTPDQATSKQKDCSSPAGGPSKSSSSKSSTGDTARRDFGDRTDDKSKKMNPSDGNDRDDDPRGGRPDDQKKDETSAGQKGSRPEGKSGAYDDPARSDRSNSAPQRNDPSKPKS